jgi:hypothetical protein
VSRANARRCLFTGGQTMTIKKSAESKPSTADSDKGLIGLFGHTYIAAPEEPGGRMIQYQFEIIRKMEGERYVVQLFSFMTGEPTNLAIYPESFLLGDDVRLYANAEHWNEGYAKTYRYRR